MTRQALRAAYAGAVVGVLAWCLLVELLWIEGGPLTGLLLGVLGWAMLTEVVLSPLALLGLVLLVWGLRGRWDRFRRVALVLPGGCSARPGCSAAAHLGRCPEVVRWP